VRRNPTGHLGTHDSIRIAKEMPRRKAKTDVHIDAVIDTLRREYPSVLTRFENGTFDTSSMLGCGGHCWPGFETRGGRVTVYVPTDRGWYFIDEWRRRHFRRLDLEEWIRYVAGIRWREMRHERWPRWYPRIDCMPECGEFVSVTPAQIGKRLRELSAEPAQMEFDFGLAIAA
jgi:hypothetical protein